MSLVVCVSLTSGLRGRGTVRGGKTRDGGTPESQAATCGIDLNLLSDLKGRVGRMKLKNAVTLEANGKLYIALDLCTLGRGFRLSQPNRFESPRLIT